VVDGARPRRRAGHRGAGSRIPLICFDERAPRPRQMGESNAPVASRLLDGTGVERRVRPEVCDAALPFAVCQSPALLGPRSVRPSRRRPGRTGRNVLGIRGPRRQGSGSVPWPAPRHADVRGPGTPTPPAPERQRDQAGGDPQQREQQVAGSRRGASLPNPRAASAPGQGKRTWRAPSAAGSSRRS
jgi:hypothetical protein